VSVDVVRLPWEEPNYLAAKKAAFELEECQEHCAKLLAHGRRLRAELVEAQEELEVWKIREKEWLQRENAWLTERASLRERLGL